MIVRYPTEDYLDRAGPHWHRYFLRGLKEMPDCQVVISPELSAVCKTPHEHLTVAEFCENDRTVRCWFDWDEWENPQYDKADSRDLYFRVNLKPSDYCGRVFPIGQCCALGTDHDYLRGLAGFRELKDAHDYNHGIIAMFRAGRRDRRVAAAQAIHDHPEWKGLAILKKWKADSDLPAHLVGKLLSRGLHWKAQAHSKIAVALPGNGETEHLDWTWRHTEILGIGACMLTIKRNTVWVGEPSDCWIEMDRNLSDFTEKVDYYLAHDADRERLAARGRRYYEEYLSPRAMVRWVLSKVRGAA